MCSPSLKFRKFGEDGYEPVEPDYPINRSDYHFIPKPMVEIPPISDHEFAVYLRACYAPRPHQQWFHKCRNPCTSLAVLQRMPLCDTELEPTSEERLEFWGIYARERISALRVTVYVLAALAPSVIFFFVWLFTMGIEGGRGQAIEGQEGQTAGDDPEERVSVDFQNPAIPLTLSIGFLTIVLSWLLSEQHNQMAALRVRP